MNIIIFSTIFAILESATIYIFAKILTRDWSFRLKESLFLVAALLYHVITNLIIPIVSMEFAIFFTFASPFLTLIYFKGIKHYSYKKSISLMAITNALLIFTNVVVVNAFRNFPPIFPNYEHTPLYIFINGLPVHLAFIIISSLVGILFVSLTRKLRVIINQSTKMLTSLTIASAVFLAFIMIFSTIMYIQGGRQTLGLSWESIFLLIASIMILVCFYFHSRSLRNKMILEQKESEQEIQQHYITQIEAKQNTINKFKHDYENILISINGFLLKKDLDGLEQYMQSVNVASVVVTEDTQTMDDLRKIKPLEIKTLLIEKIMLAQSIGINITTRIDVSDDIENVSCDSVVLVRMLGIILDNAVEALSELQSGALSVACVKDEDSVTFIVKNTCKSDMPPFSQLRQQGFSTKAKGRGLGLSNLRELADTHPNIHLQTTIKDDSFVQKLSIGEH